MSEKHTPGPWTVGTKTWSSHVIAPSKFGPHPLAVFSGRGRDEDDANAALAAAAPDLLEALEGVEPYLEEDPDNERVRAAHAAIAKARGVPQNLRDPESQADPGESREGEKSEESLTRRTLSDVY